ncbi:hypothetical protein PtB15_7B808 [Puccinia triticina]|nr:hypothetical protein PtB15_7B808 [Puccinia triticina]
MTWKPAKSNNPKLSFLINPNELAFKEFKKDVVSACNAALFGVDKTIAKAGKKGIPAIEWKAFIPNHRTHSTKGGSVPESRKPKQEESQGPPREPDCKDEPSTQCKEGSSDQAGVDNNNDEEMDDDSDNKGLVIQDQELYMSQIYARYGMNKDYDRFNPAYPHLTNVSKYLPLTDGNVRKWADVLVSPCFIA